MADERKKPKGGRRCLAGAPNKTSCGNSYYTEDITMHLFIYKSAVSLVLYLRFIGFPVFSRSPVLTCKL